jgi:ribosomal protein S18 acetylase RimI-like enzyme
MEKREQSTREKPNIIIQAFENDDFKEVMDMLKVFFKEFVDAEAVKLKASSIVDSMQDSLNNQNKYYLTAKKNNRIIGIIGIQKQLDTAMHKLKQTDRPVEIKNFFIQKAERGIGIGTMLVDKIKIQAKQSNYTEIILNSGPRYKNSGWGFYDQLIDFKRVGVIKNYYGDGIDAQVWSCILN